MRCFKARQKLNELKFDKNAIAEDTILTNHLRECPECAAFLSAEQILQRDLTTAAVDDNEETVSWWLLKSRVERQATSESRTKFKENPFMAFFSKLLKKPRLGIGISVVAVILIASALIPISYNKTIGYEVAFAGVNKNLAMDQFKIQQLLSKLGIEGANVDVSGCEATCNVKITDLKSPDDANLVKATFKKIDNVKLLEDVHAMVESESGNVFKTISISLSSDDASTCLTDSALQNIIIEKLGTDGEKEIMIWCSDSMSCDSMPFDPNNGFFFSGDDGTATMDIQATNNDDGTVTITVNAGTPDEQTITLPADGNIDAETQQQLDAMGLNMQMLHLGDDTDGAQMQMHQVVMIKGDCDTDGSTTDAANNESDSDAAAKPGDLPEKFALHQNYPNPFNPTTTISFNLPSTQHATLEVLNIQGQKVKTLMDQTLPAGEYSIDWDATNASGQKVASGTYLYKLSTPTDTEVKKMILLK